MRRDRRVLKHAKFLGQLCGPQWRRALRQANATQTGMIVECVVNLLENRLPVSRKERRELLANVDILRSLAACRNQAQARRLVLKHGVHFLSSLVSATLELIGQHAVCKV